jgi:Mg/Co/Ni transporter MgtE
MLPLHVARICLAMDMDVAAGLLAGARINEIVAVLRFIEDPTAREKFLSALSLDIATACRLLLGYSPDTVGAWMVPQVTMLAEECTVAQALEKISLAPTTIDADMLHIVDHELRLRGLITSIKTLLRSKQDTPVGLLLDPRTFAISGRASLNSVHQHEGWRHRDILPVVNRQQQLVGMLRHIDLRNGLERLAQWDGSILKNEAHSINLYRTYGNVLFELLNVINDISGSSRQS